MGWNFNMDEARADTEARHGNREALEQMTARVEEARAEATAAALGAAADEAKLSCHEGDYVANAIRALTTADTAAWIAKVKYEVRTDCMAVCQHIAAELEESEDHKGMRAAECCAAAIRASKEETR